MAERIAGIAFIMVDGQQLPLRGNLTCSPSRYERTMLAGQDRVHGYQELPRVPYIEADISTTEEVNLEDIERQTNVTVIAQCANGKQYTLTEAVVRGGFDANTRDGQFRVRWEGITCEEMTF